MKDNLIIQEKRLFYTGKRTGLYNKREKAGSYKLTFGYLQLPLLLEHVEKYDSQASPASFVSLS